MSSVFSIELWKRHLWRWLLPLLLFVSCIVLLSVYRTVYSGRVVQLEQVAMKDRGLVERLRGDREELELQVRSAAESQTGIYRLYRDTFSTERERLTDLLRKVKDLASTAGLRPDSFSYPEEVLEAHDLIRKRVIFNVEGGYNDLRRFINLLELSEDFVTLESIRVSEIDDRGTLSLSLELSTLFASEEALRAMELQIETPLQTSEVDDDPERSAADSGSSLPGGAP